MIRVFSAAGITEARALIQNFNFIYGGSPKEFPEKCIASSIYSNGVAESKDCLFWIEEIMEN